MTDEAATPSRTELAAGELRRDSLVGSFFHTDADRGWQGMVVAEPQPGTYLVELFSWIAGESTAQQLVTLAQMLEAEWRFYDTSEWMRNAYDHGVSQRWDLERQETSTDPEPPAGLVALRDIVSPVSAFVRERCDQGPYQVPISELYEAWRSWADDKGHRRLSSQQFGKDLRAVIPTINETRPRIEGEQVRCYAGIRLVTQD